MAPDPRPGGVEWGEITGTLAAQSDLAIAIAGKSASTHHHAGVYEPADPSLQTRVADIQGDLAKLKARLEALGILP